MSRELLVYDMPFEEAPPRPEYIPEVPARVVPWTLGPHDGPNKPVKKTVASADEDAIVVQDSGDVVDTNVSTQVLQARKRQFSMLEENVGFNISPTVWDNYPTIGKNGTFLLDRQGLTDIIGDFSGQSQLTLKKSKIIQLEDAFGLERGSLLEGLKIRQVDNIVDQMTRSPSIF